MELFGCVLEENVIYECVMVTLNEHSKPAPAPIGVIVQSNKLSAKIYTDTHTYSNLKRDPRATLNFVHDARTFFRAMLRKEELALKEFNGFYYLSDALAWLGVVVEEEKKESEERCVFVFKCLMGESLKRAVHPYTRADAALIEMLVHLTRIQPYLNSGMEKETLFLFELMRHYDSLIKRVAPKTEHSLFSTELLNIAVNLLKGVRLET